MGCILDGMSMIVVTLPITLPAVVVAGTGETMTRIARAVLPYFVVLLLLMALLVVAPGLALWLR